MATGTVRHSLRVPEIASDPVNYSPVTQVDFDQVGTQLVTGTMDSELSLWDVASGDLIVQWAPWSSLSVHESHFYPADEDILMITRDEASVWSATTQQRQWTGALSGFDIPTLVFHPDRHLLARAGPSYAGTFTAGLPIIGQPDGIIYLERLGLINYSISRGIATSLNTQATPLFRQLHVPVWNRSSGCVATGMWSWM
ncbi:MAG: hypothetical protein GFH27_549311n36 [Chloroflexi bacterium AL-W]|nr:hypothetical protein [Chloroflexi bacterium AL-N1]NOK68786.1 hypothetical protein [Chloroflexi bacterium AL-N10]NOK76272.1 hypothetical protein [Chloroflexi bacterium AL-N5]NOK84091.1 hypothetical protein [Chloroflexi bacterium AL-W]NOK91410.1 hypothetical protein [Chloroflexi bacterium AL-N15]